MKRTQKITMISILSLVLLIFGSISLGVVYTNYRPRMDPIQYESVGPNYWPTQKWKTSTPEEQGMNSNRLNEMVDFYEKEHAKNENIAIDSVTIIRNGYVVADIYLNPLYPKDKGHIIHSCTKSIMSALIGIAIEKGYIESVDVPVIDILNDKNIENADERIRKLTVKDLLTMKTGLHSQDSYLYRYRGLFEAQKTNDWAENILNLPFEAEPGTRFDYSSLASFLLSAIITKATGTDTLSFAQEHLFNPLGIEDVKWEKSPKGIYIGWARMWLKPHDMAKIGMLYLQKRKWKGEQIIPADWIEASITAHSDPKKYRYIYDEAGKVDRMLSGGSWIHTNIARPFTDGYGYQWWLDKSGMYTALGIGGQYIMIVPQEKLIVVFTSKLRGENASFPARLLKKFILPSIASNGSLPADKIAQKKLSLLSNAASLTLEPKSVPELPEIAPKISGKTYPLNTNPWKYNNFKLTFDSEKDYAEFSYTAKENDVVHYRVGLNGVHQLTETNNNTYAAVGSWTSPNTFSIDCEIIGYSTKDKWNLTFNGDEILIEEVGVTGKYKYRGKIQQHE
ncbi:MAG: serine hydrolase [Bacteroidetes bacterium]|nr:serine hydrolase [Bacteroidota bacterium]